MHRGIRLGSSRAGCGHSPWLRRGTAVRALCIQAGGAAASLPDRFLSQDLLSSAWLNMSKSPELGWRSACQANESIGAPEGNRRLC